MKTFLLNIMPKIRMHSKKLDDISLLTGKNWVLIDGDLKVKTVYIFRLNNDLLVSEDGVVNKSKWDYIGNNSILFDINEISLLFRHGFIDNDVLALKLDGMDEFAIMINEPLFEGGLNSIDKIELFLGEKYLPKKRVEPRIVSQAQNIKTEKPQIDFKKKEEDKTLIHLEEKDFDGSTNRTIIFSLILIITAFIILSFFN